MQPSRRGALNVCYHLRRHAHDCTPGGDIADHHRPCADTGMVANFHAGKNCRVCPDKHAPSDHDFTCKSRHRSHVTQLANLTIVIDVGTGVDYDVVSDFSERADQCAGKHLTRVGNFGKRTDYRTWVPYTSWLKPELRHEIRHQLSFFTSRTTDSTYASDIRGILMGPT